MLQRIITAVIGLSILTPVLLLDDTWVFPVVFAGLTVVGVYEMAKCVGINKKLFVVAPFFLAALFPIYVRYCYINNGGLFEILKTSMSITFIVMLYVFSVAVFAHKSIDIHNVGFFFAASFYIIAAFSSMVYIHDFIPNGQYIYLLTFICAWITDIFAYFTGSFFGKHKLIPAISPKKTVEGAIGGIIFGIISMVVFGLIIESFFIQSEVEANYLIIAISGLFIAIVSQIGDLLMSAIKRHYGIKDYGNLFPGHGGVIDRFDSILSVSLILALICTYFDFFA